MNTTIRKTTILTIFILISVALLIPSVTAAGGSGTIGDPYQIQTPAELQAMQTDLDAYYALQNDIDLSGVTWIPVGTTSTLFIGGLNGNNYTISGLTISRPTTDYQALFGILGPGAVISNINMANCDISGRGSVGALFGRVIMALGTNTTCVITNIDITNTKITGVTDYVGGLGGLSITYANLEVRYCDMENNTVSAGGYNCGGLMGFGAFTNSQATIEYCTIANCSVTSGGSNCGGLMGYGANTNSQATATDCTVENCVVISGGYHCGGLMGFGAASNSQATATDCTVENCVVISGGINCGGLMGYGAHSNSQATATGCTVISNTLVSTTGYTGGAFGRIYTGCAGYVDGCIFQDNTIIALSGISAGVIAAWS